MFKTTVVEVVPSVGAISQSWCLISCVQSSFLVWKALVNLAFSPIEFGALALHLYCYPCLSLQWKKSWLSSLSCTVDFGKSECFWDSSLSHSFVTPEGRRGSSVFFFFSLIDTSVTWGDFPGSSGSFTGILSVCRKPSNWWTGGQYTSKAVFPSVLSSSSCPVQCLA